MEKPFMNSILKIAGRFEKLDRTAGDSILTCRTKRLCLHLFRWTALFILCLCSVKAEELSATALFDRGNQAYLAGDYAGSANWFAKSAQMAPSAGAYHNLGNVEWLRSRPGPAILAWERSRWIDPFDADTKANLQFAHKRAQLENLDLAWFETCSTWLPANVWFWLAGSSFWLAVILLVLPGLLGWKRADWRQGFAAGLLALFLLCLPSLAGIHQRCKLAVVLKDQASLRLTPTQDAQTIYKLPAGGLLRTERWRGDYVYARFANDAAGWVHRDEFKLIVELNRL